MASCTYKTALMECKRAKIAAAETSAIVRYGKLHFLKSRHTAQSIIRRMPRTHIRQRIHFIHFLCSQRQSGGILYEHHFAVLLLYKFPSHVILLILLNARSDRIFFFVIANIIIRRTFRTDIRRFTCRTEIARTAHIANCMYGFPVAQSDSDFDNGMFPHPVG